MALFSALQHTHCAHVTRDSVSFLLRLLNLHRSGKRFGRYTAGATSDCCRLGELLFIPTFKWYVTPLIRDKTDTHVYINKGIIIKYTIYIHMNIFYSYRVEQCALLAEVLLDESRSFLRCIVLFQWKQSWHECALCLPTSGCAASLAETAGRHLCFYARKQPSADNAEVHKYKKLL